MFKLLRELGNWCYSLNNSIFWRESKIIAFGVTFATLGISSSAQAAIITIPTDLNPGDQYRLVFVTDSIRDGTSANIADYNTFVTNDVVGSALETQLMENGLTPDWFAIASTASVSARENTQTQDSGTNIPIYLIDGSRVANDYDDLWDGSISTAINKTPNGGSAIGNYVLTGTSETGALQFPLGSYDIPEYPPGYSGYYTPPIGTVGLGLIETKFTTCFLWPDLSTGSCEYEYLLWVSGLIRSGSVLEQEALYGMSSVLTVPTEESVESVPEPSNLLGYIALGITLLGAAVRRARKSI